MVDYVIIVLLFIAALVMSVVLVLAHKESPDEHILRTLFVAGVFTVSAIIIALISYLENH